MYCQKCGTKLEEGVKFCQSCGAQVAQAPAANSNTTEQVSIVEKVLYGNNNVKTVKTPTVQKKGIGVSVVISYFVTLVTTVILFAIRKEGLVAVARWISYDRHYFEFLSENFRIGFSVAAIVALVISLALIIFDSKSNNKHKAVAIIVSVVITAVCFIMIFYEKEIPSWEYYDYYD